MVQAGVATDAVIDELVPLLDAGDIVVDCGNAHFADTRRREAALAEQGLHFVGRGVSGDEEGAHNGPSIMPGGSEHACARLTPILTSIAAEAEAEVDGDVCVAQVGPDGAGHFVKMVRNGIEYADMQVIAEAYDLLHSGLRAPAAHEIADTFTTWNAGDLESFFARSLSGHAERRGPPGPAREVFGTHTGELSIGDRDAFVEDVRKPLYSSKVVAYAQGFDQIKAGSEVHGWVVDRGTIASIWHGGCIIAPTSSTGCARPTTPTPNCRRFLVAPYFADAVKDGVAA